MDSSATVNSLSFLALTLASNASDRGILGEKSRIAYQRLTEILAEYVGGDPESLSTDASSPPTLRPRGLAKIEQSFEGQAKLKSLTIALVQALEADVVRGSLGISLRKLEIIRAGLADIDDDDRGE